MAMTLAINRKNIVESLRALAHEGTTIVYSTHYFAEVEFVRPRVVILSNGCKVFDGAYDRLLDRSSLGAVELVYNGVVSAAPHPKSAIRAITESNVVTYEAYDTDAVLAELLATENWPPGEPRSLGVKARTLEDVFRQITGVDRG